MRLHHNAGFLAFLAFFAIASSACAPEVRMSGKIDRPDLRKDEVIEDEEDLRTPRDLAKGKDASTDDGGTTDDDMPTGGGDDAAIVVDDSDIRDVQNGLVATGELARISGVVTGVDPKSNFFFVQEPDGAPEFSGIAVYFVPTAPFTKPEVGDTVTVQGTVKEFKTTGAALSRTNLEDITALDIGAKVALPAPVVIASPASLNVEATAEPYECVLVRVNAPTVTKAADTYKEFQITGSVFVDDRLYDYSTKLPKVGDSYAFLQGPFDYNNGHYKILPRSADDMPVGEAPLNLVSVTPASSSVVEGMTRTLTITLSRAPAVNTTLTVTSSDSTIANPTAATVTVDAGKTTATATITGVLAATDPETITIGLAGSTPATLTATITVTAVPGPVTLSLLSPAVLSVHGNVSGRTAAERTGLVEVQLSDPAGPGGGLVLLESSDPAKVAVPSEVIIPEGQTKGSFRVRADATTTAAVTITALDSTLAIATMTVNVVTTAPAPSLPAVAKELIINELVYSPPFPGGDADCNGQRNAAGDEFVELVNISTHPIDLLNVSVWDDQATGSAPRYKFASVVLGPGEVVLVYGKADTSNTSVTPTPVWCTSPVAETATTIGDARVYTATQSLSFGNSGDTVTVSLASKSDVLDTVTYTTTAAEDMSYERNPQRAATATFIKHTSITSGATDRAITPGTYASGLPFSLANP